jgi:hypothetical protein
MPTAQPDYTRYRRPENQVINHVRVSDMVGAANGHFGEVRFYASVPLPKWQRYRCHRRSLADCVQGFHVANTAVQKHGGTNDSFKAS